MGTPSANGNAADKSISSNVVNPPQGSSRPKNFNTVNNRRKSTPGASVSTASNSVSSNALHSTARPANDNSNSRRKSTPANDARSAPNLNTSRGKAENSAKNAT